MEVALASAMVPYPRAEASFFWGLAPLMDSPCYLPQAGKGFTEGFTPSQVLKEGCSGVLTWVCPQLRALRFPDLSGLTALLRASEVPTSSSQNQMIQGCNGSPTCRGTPDLFLALQVSILPASAHLCSWPLMTSVFSASIPVLVLLIMVSWSHCVDKNVNFTSLCLRHSCMSPAHAHIHPSTHACLLSSTVLCTDASLGAAGTALVDGWLMVWWSPS